MIHSIVHCIIKLVYTTRPVRGEHMKCLYNGRIITPEGILEGKALLYDKKISNIIDMSELDQYTEIEEKIDAEGRYISPGFIDIHIHGGDGKDVCDGSKDGVLHIANYVASTGVTSFLPTTMTLEMNQLRTILDTVRDAKAEQTTGAEILGVHLEGPFINKALKGAQDGTYIVPPSEELVMDYKDIISLITLAPEVEGAYDFIAKMAKETDIVLSMGHTNATYDEAMKGIEKGITHSTHTFNAMSKLHHREPGVVGAALTTDVCCELIADKIHVHPAIFKLLLRAKGTDKIILVTDCVRAGGLAEGEYTLGGQKIIVKDGISKLESGTIAGSILRLNQAVKNFDDAIDEVTLSDVIGFVTENPAKSLGIYDRKGSIEVGKDADLVIFDDDLEVKMTLGKGTMLYEK